VDRTDVVRFLRAHKLAVQSSIAEDGAPQAAVVGYAVTDALEVVFDTVKTSRKYQNLLRDPRVAVVVWVGETTVQLEGVVDFPSGAELDRIRECYFDAYPDGRERLAWPGLVHARVRVRWLRYSDFAKRPPEIVELKLG
jgi:hypothetical protein